MRVEIHADQSIEAKIKIVDHGEENQIVETDRHVTTFVTRY